jgi:eukaryotic-like serine/threonine-protein kinase
MDLPSLIGSKYRPLRMIGQGGMGVVYEVEHLHTGQRFALKVLTRQPGASVERFKREARAVSRIQSDHVVRVTDADVAPELGGAPFLVMDLLEGADLEAVAGDRPAAPADVVCWLRQVARALVKAHESGIVHRDLKPENIFLTRREDGSPLVKLLDFGIAKMTAEGTALTQSNSFLGTPGYMAPEQTDTRGPPVTLRADLYALGLITFRLLVGRMYWQAGSLSQLFVQILTDPMPPPSERGSTLGPAFDAWFFRACNRVPAHRFSTADQQIEALAEALGVPEQARMSDRHPRVPTPPVSGMPTGTPSLGASYTDLRTTKRKRGRLWLAGVGIAGPAAAVFAAALLARGGGHGQDASRAAPTDPGISMTTLASPAPGPSPQASSSVLASPTPSADSIDGGAPSNPLASPPPPKPPGTVAIQKRPASAPSAKSPAPKARDPLEGAY